MELLRIENLCKVYGKGENPVTALDHISLTIEKGGFTAIIGTSGSGKSTLLHTIAGVDKPTSGKIYLDGQDVYAQSNEKLAIFRRAGRTDLPIQQTHPSIECGGKYHITYPDGQTQGQRGTAE
jgi:ABC-type lipoprotein export system ATPase subunit